MFITNIVFFHWLIATILGQSSQYPFFEFHFDVGKNGDFKDEQLVTCEQVACVPFVSWNINTTNEECLNPRVSISIMDTYKSFEENPEISIFGNLIGSCNITAPYCDYDFIECDSVSNYNMSKYFNYSSSEQERTINISVTSYVGNDACDYNKQYYFYSIFTFECDVPRNITTPSPTIAPTYCDESSNSGFTTFNTHIRLNFDEDAISWELIDDSDNEVVYNGSGVLYGEGQTILEEKCISNSDDKCYTFNLYNSNGFGLLGVTSVATGETTMSGWFEISLTNEINHTITLGTQTFDDFSISIYWCMSLLSNIDGNNNNNNKLYINGTDGWDTYIHIYNMSNNNQLIYSNDLRSQIALLDYFGYNYQNLLINRGCYQITFETAEATS